MLIDIKNKIFTKTFISLTILLAVFLLFVLAETTFAIPAMYQRCEINTTCVISEYVFNDDGKTAVTTDNYCKITITNPNDMVLASAVNMSDKNDGWYYYSTSTISAPAGLYRTLVCCDIGGAEERCIDKTFILGTSFDTITNIEYDLDLVRGATFDFSGFADSGTTLTLVDSELSQPDDYWNNYRLKMMSGSNIGEEQTVSDFVASSDTITVSSAFSNPIVSGDKYVLLHETRLVYTIWNYSTRTLTSAANVAGDIWGYSGGRTLTSIGSLAADIWDDTYATTRRLTDKVLTGGGSLSTESYINTATSTIITEINANETLISSLNSDISSLSATTTLILNKWDTNNASDIIGYVDGVENLLGTLSDATTTNTIFGRVNLLQEKWGIQTSQTIFDKASSTLVTIQEIQTELGYNGTSTTAYTDMQLVKGYVDELESYVGVPTDTATSTLFGAIKDVRTKIDQLDILGTKLDTVDAVADLIRASQQVNYTVELSDAGEVLQGNNYRVKLSVWDYENNPTNASTTPSIVIYDSSRTIATSTSMTLLSTGVYEFIYSVPSNAISGFWETVANVDLGGSSDLTLNDYWEVEGSPAQVIINSMSDVSITSVSANVTISNEGNADYEYQYEWCVVDSESNACGGGDDIDYASAAKYLTVGQDWTTTLSATVPDIGNYWFKVVVYYGTEASGASRTFTTVGEVSSVGGIEATTPTSTINLSNVYSLLQDLHNEVGYHKTGRTAYQDISNTRYSLGALPDQLSEPLYEVLTGISSDIQTIGGDTAYSLNDIYEISKINTDNLSYITNKTSELRAMAEINKTLVSKVANKPVIQTWFTEGSIILNIMVVNPPDMARMVKVKEYLPKEIREEHIIKIEDGLTLEYDSNLDSYFVSGEVKLKAGERKIFKVRAEDIFSISEEEISSLKEQAKTLLEPLKGTGYFAQASILKSEIDANLRSIYRTQIEGSANIERKISVYRNNQKDFIKVKENIEALKVIVSEVSNNSGILGSLFGVSATMTWAMIVIVVVGIAVLMILLYILLMKSRALEHHISGGRKLKTPPLVNIKKHTTKIKGGLITYFLPPFGKPKVNLKQLIKMIKILISVVVVIVLILFGMQFLKSKKKIVNSEVKSTQESIVTTLDDSSSGINKFIDNSNIDIEMNLSLDKREVKEEVIEETILKQDKLKIIDTSTGGLNVYDKSSILGKILGKVYSGEEYIFEKEKEGWYYIVIPNGIDGWISGNYVEIIE